MISRASIVLAVTLVAVSAAVAAQRPQPKTYYLALGDSIAYGVQPDKVRRGLPPSAYDTGYVDVVATRLRTLNPRLEVVNYSCPGESTVTFTRGGCPWLAEGRKLHDRHRGTQMQAALAFVRAHPDQVGPITVTLWGNDVIPAFDGCKDLVACARTRAPNVIAAVAARLESILRRLRSAAPHATIIVTGAWNFDDESPRLTRLLFLPLNAAIERAAAAGRARFANIVPSFNPTGGGAADRARLCAYTFICSKDDVHPTDAGYRAIATAVVNASGYVRRG